MKILKLQEMLFIKSEENWDPIENENLLLTNLFSFDATHP